MVLYLTASLVSLSLCLVFWTTLYKVVSSVGCYVCNSLNGTDPVCEDPFNPVNATYIENCMDGRDKIIGRFPTRYCVKISGWSLADNTYLYIRRCTWETLGDQTGVFVFERQSYAGSILTCDYDGCNFAFRVDPTKLMISLASGISLVWHRFAYTST